MEKTLTKKAHLSRRLTEQYLQRLEKWRSEREAKKEGKDVKNKQRPLAEIKGNKHVTAASHPTVKAQADSEEKHSTTKVTCKTSQETKTQKVSHVTTSQTKSVRPVAQDSKKFVEVKSRLFDYLNKPGKPQTVAHRRETLSKKPSENTKPKHNTKQDAKTMKKDSKPVVSVKSGLKRRHSEVASVPAKKPAGILKRKSCIPSIDRICDNDADNVARNIDCNTEEQSDDVFMSGTQSKDIPVAMVTPGTARSVRFTSPANRRDDNKTTLRKTPLKPSEMRNQLSDWLKAKGRTPSKFRHLMCFHDNLGEEEAEPQTKSSLSVEELSEQIDVINFEEVETQAQEKLATMLEECMTLFEAGCPVKDIMPWLDDIYKKIPQAKSSAKFYECKANVVKSTLDMDSLLEIFETAYINNAQPREHLAKTLSESIKYVNSEQLQAAKRRRGTPRRSGMQEENMFQSSAIVYTVSEATPFSESKTGKRCDNTPGEKCKVITPVRRSTRRSLQNLPSSLKDKKDMYKSLSDVDANTRDNMLFQPNIALDNLLSQVEGD